MLMNFLKNQKGAAAIEFGITIPILFVMVVCVINMGYVLMKENELNSAVNAGFLHANKNADNTAAISAAVSAATRLKPLSVSVTSFCSCSDGATLACNAFCSDHTVPGTYIKITASSTIKLYAPALFMTNLFPISATGTVRVK